MSTDAGADRLADAAATQDLVDALAQLSFEVMGRLTALAAEEELSLTQLRMLAVLRDRRPRMAELAALLGLDRSSITGLIGRAEQRGFVTRSAVEGDGRGVHVHLTEEGRAFTDRVADRVGVALAALIGGLDTAARRSLATALAAMLPSP